MDLSDISMWCHVRGFPVIEWRNTQHGPGSLYNTGPHDYWNIYKKNNIQKLSTYMLFPYKDIKCESNENLGKNSPQNQSQSRKSHTNVKKQRYLKLKCFRTVRDGMF